MKTIQSLAASFAFAAGLGLLSGLAYSADTQVQLRDGTVEAGISPETGRTMYTTAADAPGTFTFDEAKDYCAGFDANGHHDWRVPTKNELNELFNNRAAIGGFNESGSDPAGWYWSSTVNYSFTAWAQRFSDGAQI